MTRDGPPMMRGRKIRDELLCCMAPLPLLVLDFRITVSLLPACSDVSEAGSGVCYATRLSQQGKALPGTAARSIGPGRVVPVLLVESLSLQIQVELGGGGYSARQSQLGKARLGTAARSVGPRLVPGRLLLQCAQLTSQCSSSAELRSWCERQVAGATGLVS